MGLFRTKYFCCTPFLWGRPGGEPPVYWANDLFLRRAISLAADVADSGRTAPPRTSRHGYPRASLPAARRTLDSRGQARLAILLRQAPAAPARAPLHLAHPPDRPRG